jgi:low affinity Fe/Cu permease
MAFSSVVMRTGRPINRATAKLCRIEIRQACCEGLVPLPSSWRPTKSRVICRGGTESGVHQLSHVTFIRKCLTYLGASTSHPVAFAIVGIYVVAWLCWDPGSFGWQSVAAVATWFMTLLIQRAEHRDTQAIHAKLDELLRVESRSNNELTKLDEKEPEEIESHRAQSRL